MIALEGSEFRSGPGGAPRQAFVPFIGKDLRQL
jgi:hypothetical protein